MEESIEDNVRTADNKDFEAAVNNALCPLQNYDGKGVEPQRHSNADTSDKIVSDERGLRVPSEKARQKRSTLLKPPVVVQGTLDAATSKGGGQPDRAKSSHTMHESRDHC
jgi:hypothetical protein